MSTNNLEHLKDSSQGFLRTDSVTELQETSERSRQAESSLSPASAPGQHTPASSPPPPFPHTPANGSPVRRPHGSRAGRSRFVVTGIVIFLLAATTLGVLILPALRNTNTPANTVQVVGHVSFISSEQLYVNNNQGINDEVLIDLHHIPAAGPGKSYYAWLLGDANKSDIPWIPLGKLLVAGGNVHFLYPGDQAHTNLLSDMSRFLITEEDANTAPISPLFDQSAWRYYGEIYQGPSPTDPSHFTLLDHLRHLLVQAPELKALGLPGGLSIWLLRNVQEISKWALSAKERWEIHDSAFMRQQLVNILYYLDGECTQGDLQGVQPGTATTPENGTIAHIAHFALLNPCVQEEQEQANILKQVFQHVPHNYVDHMLFHMAGVIQSPGARPALHTLAIQINTAINNVKNWLGQVRQDALQLLHMSDSQLIQLTGLDILSDLEREARYALTGGTDPNTGDTQEGAAWVFDNIQRLTTLDVMAYSPHK